MKCRYCARTLRVIPHSPVETEPHCQRRGCRWCAECFRGETSVSPSQGAAPGALSLDLPGWPGSAPGFDQPYQPRHRRPEPGPGRTGERAA